MGLKCSGFWLFGPIIYKYNKNKYAINVWRLLPPVPGALNAAAYGLALSRCRFVAVVHCTMNIVLQKCIHDIDKSLIICPHSKDALISRFKAPLSASGLCPYRHTTPPRKSPQKRFTIFWSLKNKQYSLNILTF